MPYCNDCGAQASDNASFCPECGSKLTAGPSVGREVNPKSSCPSCGSSDNVRWSVMNKSWMCDTCGHSWDTSSGFVAPTHELDERSPISYRRPAFPFTKAITVIVILVVIGAAIGVPLWWFLPTYPLIIVTEPTDGGVVTGSGDYHRNADAQISAVPNEYFDFTGWTGIDVANPSSTSTTVHIGSTDHEVIANFERYCTPPGEGHEYWEFYNRQPDYNVILDNNDGATNPTWSELEAFLINDKTDQETYVEPSFMCGEFAEQVHNNAEKAGIKTGWVRIAFEDDNEDDHALNAFRTTDAGLVFVDCTGLEDSTSKSSKDKIAYFKKGKEYGVISLDIVDNVADGFPYENYQLYRYETYQLYRQNCDLYEEEYENALETYNEHVRAFNNVVNRCGGECIHNLPESDECSCFNWTMEVGNLENAAVNVDRLYDKLCEDRWELGGTVKEYKIYW